MKHYYPTNFDNTFSILLNSNIDLLEFYKNDLIKIVDNKDESIIFDPNRILFVFPNDYVEIYHDHNLPDQYKDIVQSTYLENDNDNNKLYDKYSNDDGSLLTKYEIDNA
jgi:hypothetical protein